MSIDIAFEALHTAVFDAYVEMDRLRTDKRTLIVALRMALPVLYRCSSTEEIEIAETALAAAERRRVANV
jgi:hypothetical protein